MNKKILILAISLLTIVMVVPIGTSFASEPVEVTSVMLLNAEIVSDLRDSSRIAGQKIISDRELTGSFTSGPFVGDIYRKLTGQQHYLEFAFAVNSYWEWVCIRVQSTVCVDNAVVTVDGVVAEGSFVMKMMGMGGNAKWTIISSDLTADGEPVRLYGEGTWRSTAFIPIDEKHYNIKQTLTGQVSLTP